MSAATDALRVTEAIGWLERHWREQPDLDRVAAAVGLSGPHFQRVFKRFAGVSPKRFLQFLTAEHARDVLGRSRSVLDASYDLGLSGPGRLHDLTVAVHALTPGELRRLGEGVSIRYGLHDSPFGPCRVGVTDRGICALAFTDGRDPDAALGARWPRARLVRDDAGTAHVVRRAFAPGGGAPLDVRGTNFQVRVWEALLRIPEGALVTYRDVAQAIGRPKAARAVGSAVAANEIAVLIPCHRVIRSTGVFGDYRWGAARKKAIVGREIAATSPSSAAR